jgi:hypothetical protein
MGEIALTKAREREEVAHARIVQQEVEFGCGHPGAERHDNRSECARSKKDLEPFYAIARQQSDWVAAPDPARPQSLCDPSRPAGERRVGDAAGRRDRNRLVWRFCRLLAEQLEGCTTEGRLHMISGLEDEKLRVI